MARTRASVGAKVAAGKSNKARCSAPPPPSTPSTSGTSEKSSRTHSGGNPVCPRETPKWQKPITNFFIGNQSKHVANISDDDQIAAGPSKPRTKVNVIESDEEPDVTETPKNQDLDESIVLEPLCGENSHKIEEYYNNKDKGKNVSDKENIDLNGNSKLSKRLLEEEADIGQPSKKAKISRIE